MHTVHPSQLSRGMVYFGRRDWLLTVESVRVIANGQTAEIRSLNVFGEEVTERYPIRHVLQFLPK